MTNSWQKTKLTDLCRIVNGKTPLRSKSTYWDGGSVNWFTIDDMRRQGRFIYNTSQHITDIALKETGLKLVPKESVLVCCTASVGEVAYSLTELTTNQQFNALVPNNRDLLDSLFLYYAVDYISPELTKQMGTTTFGFVSISKLGEIKIPLPNIKTQQKIGDILSSIDEAIQKTDQVIQKSEELKQGMLSDFFSKKDLVNWINYKLGNATKFIDYRGKTPTKVHDGIPLITAKNVRMGFIEREPREYIKAEDYDSWMTRGIPHKGDVLFTTEAPLGNIAQIDTDEKLAFAQRVIIMQPIKEVNATFLKYLLMSDQIQIILKSFSSGGTVKGIKAKVLKQIEIPVPSLQEQQKIAEMMTDCDEKISKEKKFKNKLLILKAALMHDIFNQKVQIN